MPTDLTMAMEMSLLAAGYHPVPKKDPNIPFPGILQDLLDYVRSPEYRKLEIEEFIKAHANAKPHE
jgi:hypothetical protein